MVTSSKTIARRGTCDVCGERFRGEFAKPEDPEWRVINDVPPVFLCPLCLNGHVAFEIDYPVVVVKTKAPSPLSVPDGGYCGDWRDDIDLRLPSEKGLAAAFAEIYSWGYDGPAGGGDNLVYDNIMNDTGDDM